MRLRRSDAVGKEEELAGGGVDEGEGVGAGYGGGDVDTTWACKWTKGSVPIKYVVKCGLSR